MTRQTQASFPLDDYTPYGYLDVPEHTRRLTPKGVLRSRDVGFGWHFPALATSYGGRRETYRTSVRVGVDGALALADFDEVRSPYHSKDLVRFVAERGPARCEADFVVVGSDVVAAFVDATAERHTTVRVDYTRLVGADHGWGESGLVGRREGDLLVLQGFEDGEAFALAVLPTGSGEGPDTTADVTEFVAGVTADSAESDRWTAGGPQDTVGSPVTVLGEPGQEVTLSAVVSVPANGRHRLLVLLSRGRTADEATTRLAEARASALRVRTTRLRSDDAFWSRAPRLTGDWPAHWRRGLVYDLETLRMMVKPPVGIYHHVWDGMQIQAPRVVLGEAAIDALLLSYADPRLAQELLLGVFADAPLPNVPCSREDGSYNMVSADGTVCGTGPQWGYPWPVVAHLFAAQPDHAWLARIYPPMAAYLDWWLAHRRDADGWLVHACSWESGQDLSPRFGDQPLGGGHPTWSVRPVDLQATFADAAATMADLAGVLGRDQDVQRWRDLAAEFSDRTARMWTGERYADVDARTGEATAVDDVMLLAPLALGQAGAEQVDALREAVRAADPDTTVWPMFAWTAVDAAEAAGEYDTAARVAGGVVDRAYGFWDARRHEPGRTLPGVACEYWPLSGRCGGEGYGWGAFTTHLLLGTLAGLRPEDEGLRIRPNLPAGLRVPGRAYGVELTVRDIPVRVRLEPRTDGVEVTVNDRLAKLTWGEEARWHWHELTSG
ncbi:MGH1-like glycoside hydrolase domain-containing protein [Actinopolymorpha singaporensis]